MTVFIDSALMREGEPQRVVKTFADMKIPVRLVDARAALGIALSSRHQRSGTKSRSRS
jgi:GMP synthase PP-ATPase subunit